MKQKETPYPLKIEGAGELKCRRHFFTYLRQNEDSVKNGGSAKLKEAFIYALDQEKYLRVFLTDGEVPMDNNASLCSGYFYPHLLPKTA